jgi:putative transposase
MKNPFRYFNSSPEIIRLTVMMYIRYPFVAVPGRGSVVRTRHRHLPRDGTVLVEPVRSIVQGKIRKRRVQNHSYSNWRWHLDEVFVKINGETTTSGGPSITRAKYLKFLRRNGGIAGLRFSF